MKKEILNLSVDNFFSFIEEKEKSKKLYTYKEFILGYLKKEQLQFEKNKEENNENYKIFYDIDANSYFKKRIFKSLTTPQKEEHNLSYFRFKTFIETINSINNDKIEPITIKKIADQKTHEDCDAFLMFNYIFEFSCFFEEILNRTDKKTAKNCIEKMKKKNIPVLAFSSAIQRDIDFFKKITSSFQQEDWFDFIEINNLLWEGMAKYKDYIEKEATPTEKNLINLFNYFSPDQGSFIGLNFLTKENKEKLVLNNKKLWIFRYLRNPLFREAWHKSFYNVKIDLEHFQIHKNPSVWSFEFPLSAYEKFGGKETEKWILEKFSIKNNYDGNLTDYYNDDLGKINRGNFIKLTDFYSSICKEWIYSNPNIGLELFKKKSDFLEKKWVNLNKKAYSPIDWQLKNFITEQYSIMLNLKNDKTNNLSLVLSTVCSFLNGETLLKEVKEHIFYSHYNIIDYFEKVKKHYQNNKNDNSNLRISSELIFTPIIEPFFDKIKKINFPIDKRLYSSLNFFYNKENNEKERTNYFLESLYEDSNKIDLSTTQFDKNIYTSILPYYSKDHIYCFNRIANPNFFTNIKPKYEHFGFISQKDFYEFIYEKWIKENDINKIFNFFIYYIDKETLIIPNEMEYEVRIDTSEYNNPTEKILENFISYSETKEKKEFLKKFLEVLQEKIIIEHFSNQGEYIQAHDHFKQKKNPTAATSYEESDSTLKFERIIKPTIEKYLLKIESEANLKTNKENNIKKQMRF